MAEVNTKRTVYCFGCNILDVGRAALLGPGGREIPLRPKAFDVLRCLVENAGRVVSREELLETVWPGLHINDDGITQCVREVRRALGDDAQLLVRTVAKRGYLLAADVMSPRLDHDGGQISRDVPDAPEVAASFSQAEIGASALPDLDLARAPRLSLVVLPFVNQSGDLGQEYLADAVTDDLTTDLSQLDGAFIIGRGSARTYAGGAADARRVGPELGVRYVVHGSVRKAAGSKVRVNAELVSTETGASLWADRFDQAIDELSDGQGDIVRRLASALGARLVDVESERSVRERPNNPDAFDLVLRARSLLHCAFSLSQAREAETLLDRALVLDPRSVPAMVHLAYCLMSQNDSLAPWKHSNTLRALDLLQSAESQRPNAIEVIALRGAMLLWTGRYDEGRTVYERVLSIDSNFTTAYHQIGATKLWTGDPEGALPFYQEALRRDPVGSGVHFRCGVIGYALLLAKRPVESIAWLRRAIQENPARREFSSVHHRAYLASALALTGDLSEARQEITEVVCLAPTWTARSWDMRQWQPSPLGEQLRYVAEGLRAAGLRDHADEDYDSGIPATAKLSESGTGPTPMEVPGATTIRTEVLQQLLVEHRPVVIDVNTIGWSIPGAIVLGFDPAGGTFADTIQERLRSKMNTLTNGNTAYPVVVLGWNAERWGSHNVVLRIVAMGYTRVYWYRGGKEVWIAKGLPTNATETVDLAWIGPVSMAIDIQNGTRLTETGQPQSTRDVEGPL